MRPRVEDVVGNGAELLMNSVGNFRPAMADLTQPQAAHAVDVFVAFGVPEAHTFATDKFAKLLLVLGRLGIGVQQFWLHVGLPLRFKTKSNPRQSVAA